MKVQTKVTLLLMSVGAVLLFVIAVAQYVRNKELNLYLKSKYESDKTIIYNVLDFKGASFLNYTIDNALWDEAVEFVRTRDSVWGFENYGISLQTFDLNYFNVYDFDGQLFYAAEKPGSPELSIGADRVKSWFSDEKTVRTFAYSDQNLFEIFGSAIVPSVDLNYDSLESGYLVAIKLWDEDYISEIEQATGFKLKILPHDHGEMYHNESTFEVIIIPVNDFDETPLCLLMFSRPDELYTDLTSFDYMLVATLIILLTFIIIYYYLTNKWLANPLKNIAASLTKDDLKPIEHLTATRDEFGEIARLVVQFAEQKKKLLDEIEKRTQATERYRDLLTVQPDIMLLTDQQGVLLDYYASKNTWLKNNFGDLIGKNINDLLPDGFIKKHNQLLDKILSTKEVLTIEFNMSLPDGHFTFELRMTASKLNEVLYIVRDITEKTQAVKALKINEARLRELNATKDKFFSIIAHDLKSPFNSILGFSGLLSEQLKEKDYENIDEYANLIKQSSQNAYDLLMNLLEWARSQTGKLEFSPEYFEMVVFVNQTILPFNNLAAQKSIVIKTDLPNMLPVYADKHMVSTVIRNLISNAIKFTRPGGAITIKAKKQHNEILISVSDNGVGISKNRTENLFRIDQNTSTAGTANEQGTGLGLILCKEFVEKHKGRIWVESEENSGSTFTFTLPQH